MSTPTEFDFMEISVGDGATPENFTKICGLTAVAVNHTAQTSDRFVRDCAYPNRKAKRKVRVTGEQQDITGSGLSNAHQIALLKAAVGKSKNYEIVGFRDDGTDAGAELGTYSGAYVMTAHNISTDQNGDSSMEVTLASDGDFTWTAAS